VNIEQRAECGTVPNISDVYRSSRTGLGLEDPRGHKLIVSLVLASRVQRLGRELECPGLGLASIGLEGPAPWPRPWPLDFGIDCNTVYHKYIAARLKYGSVEGSWPQNITPHK